MKYYAVTFESRTSELYEYGVADKWVYEANSEEELRAGLEVICNDLQDIECRVVDIRPATAEEIEAYERGEYL
jgi:hypothetical protein